MRKWWMAMISNVAAFASDYVGWWKLDGNGNDSSSYTNNGTTSNITYDTDKFGNANSCAVFNGTNSQILIPNSSSIEGLGSGFTISGLFYISAYPTGSKNYFTLFNKRIVYTSDKAEFLAIINDDNAIAFVVYDNIAANNISVSIPRESILLSQWNSIVFSYDGGNNFSSLKIYVNGVAYNQLFKAVGSFSSIKDKALDMFIGRIEGYDLSILNGKADECYLWKKVLTPLEITNLMIKYQTYGISCNNVVVISGDTATISPSGSATHYNFYDSLTGGFLLYSGEAYTTPTLTTSKYIYVSAVYGSYETSRIAVNICVAPSILSTADLFLVADVENNGKSFKWKDNSINNSSLISAGSPTVIENALNGHKVMRFNGSTDYFDGGTAMWQIGTQGETIFIVGKNNVGTTGWYICKALWGVGPARRGIGYDPGVIYSAYNSVYNTSPRTTGSYELLSVVWDRTALTNTLFANGTTIGSWGLDGGDPTNNYSFIIGGYNNSSGGVPPATFLTGDIAEIIIYNRPLSDIDRETVQTYLNTKYGI